MTPRWPLVAVPVLLGGALLVQWSRGLPSEAFVADRPTAAPSYQGRLGAEAYRHYCETCHGADGKGDGFNAFNLDPKPPDFTSSSFQQTRTDEQLGTAIASGGRSVDRSAAMPPWGRTLSPVVQRAVLLHIRRFGAGTREDSAAATGR